MSDDILETDEVHSSGQVTRDGKTYGCHVDLGHKEEPDGCVLDYGCPDDCVYARHKNGVARDTRWTCEYWRVVR